MSASAPLRFALLGGFGVAADGGPFAPAGTPRVQSLLAYLLLHRETPQLRQHVAFLLWPDSTEGQAQTNLRNLLHRLGKTLPEVKWLLNVESAHLRWRSDAAFRLDVADFDAAMAQADQVARGGDTAATQAALEQVLALYRGELLPGLSDEWIVTERERITRLFVRALGQLISVLEDRREYREAIDYAERLVRHDRLNEAAYRQLMRLHALAGDAASALSVYAACASVLKRELGVEPETATLEAAARLQRGLTATATPSPRGSGRPPLVGREQEWAALRHAWEKPGRQPQLVVLRGEAGIGKTRLAEELLEWRSRQGNLTATARCYPGGKISFAPITAWLREPDLKEALPALADLWLTEVSRILPELLVERHLPHPTPMREDWQRHRLFEALARALVAAEQPLLLVLDDLQLCDQATLDWLTFFLHWTTSTQVVLCATLRIEELDSDSAVSHTLAGLQRDGRVQELELKPLTVVDTEALAAQVAGRALPPALLQELCRESEGNPLYVVEAVRAGDPGLVPATVQTVIAGRLARLSPAARDLAGLAATIGRGFEFELLAHASTQAEDEVVARLDELTQRRVVREQGHGSYDFSHEKIRSVAYANLSAARRRLLHSRVAEGIEALHVDAEPLSAVLAHHHEAAGHLERAIALFQRAGEAARHVYANADAVTHFSRALALLGALASDPVRAQTAAALHERLGDTLHAMADLAAAAAAFQAARRFMAADDVIGQARLQRKTGLARDGQHAYADALAAYAAAAAALGPEPASPSAAWWHEWIEIQLGQLMVHYWTADSPSMMVVASALRPIVDCHGAPLQRARYLQWLANANHRRERYVPSDETIGYCRAVLRETLEAGPAGGEADAHFILGFALLWHGELAEAERELAAARSLAEHNGQLALRTRATFYLATLCRLDNRPEPAGELATATLALASATHLPEYVGGAHGHLAWVSLRHDDRLGAAAHAAAALDAWSGMATVYSFLWNALWPLVELAVARGDLEEAARHVRTMLDSKQQRFALPLTRALEDMLRTWDTGRRAAARAHLDAARALARDIGYL